MSRGAVFSETPGGTDRIWLDQLGEIAGLVHSTCYPGGDFQAQWQMNLNFRAQHRAWTYGRRIGISVGANHIWHGNLDNPTRGTTWQMTAVGLTAQAKQYSALAASSGNALDLGEVIPAAIGRGLQFTVPSGLTWPTMLSTAATVPSGSIQCDGALDQVAAAQTVETYWSIDTHGAFSPDFAAPTTPTYILYATAEGGGRTLDGFVTDAYVIYQSASGVITVDLRSAASRPFGRFEQPYDQTALGLIPSSQADALGDGFLARNSARAKFTGDFTVTAGQLTTMGGQAVDLATVRAGFLANVVLLDPDSAGEVALGVIPQVLIGTTSYDWDAGILTLTPVYSAADNLTALLGAGSAAA